MLNSKKMGFVFVFSCLHPVFMLEFDEKVEAKIYPDEERIVHVSELQPEFSARRYFMKADMLKYPQIMEQDDQGEDIRFYFSAPTEFYQNLLNTEGSEAGEEDVKDAGFVGTDILTKSREDGLDESFVSFCLVPEYDQIFFTNGFIIKTAKINATLQNVKLLGGAREIIPGKIRLRLQGLNFESVVDNLDHITVNISTKGVNLHNLPAFRSSYTCLPTMISALYIECAITFDFTFLDKVSGSLDKEFFSSKVYRKTAYQLRKYLIGDDITIYLKKTYNMSKPQVISTKLFTRGRSINFINVIRENDEYFLIWNDLESKTLHYVPLTKPKVKEESEFLTSNVKQYQEQVLLKHDGFLSLFWSTFFKTYHIAYFTDMLFHLNKVSFEIIKDTLSINIKNSIIHSHNLRKEIMQLLDGGNTIKFDFNYYRLIMSSQNNGIMLFNLDPERPSSFNLYTPKQLTYFSSFCTFETLDEFLFLVEDSMLKLHKLRETTILPLIRPFVLVQDLQCVITPSGDYFIYIIEYLGRIRRLNVSQLFEGADFRPKLETLVDLQHISRMSELSTRLESFPKIFLSSFYSVF